jgi:hypothetical protein
MKQPLILILSAFACAMPAPAADIAALKGGDLVLTVDDAGKVVSLKNAQTGRDYAKGPNAPASHLMRCQTFGETSPQVPVSAKVVERTDAATTIELAYKSGATLRVKAETKPKYLRMEVVGAAPPKTIATVEWGPFQAAMRGPCAKWVTLARDDAFTIGLLPLEANTVRGGAEFNKFGTRLTMRSHDQTTTRNLSHEQRDVPLAVEPIPGLTVLHSAVALFGCPGGRDSELDRIEAVALGEKLPHPMWKGTWIKRSREMSRMRVWTGFDEKSMDTAIGTARDLGAISLGRFHGFYSNWGHHDIDKRVFPGGWAALKRGALKAQKNGIQLEFYTMSHFLKPMTQPEPYLAPVPDPRLAHLKVKPRLLAPIDADAKQLAIAYDKTLAEYWTKHANHRVVQIDDEILEAGAFDGQPDKILLKDLTRGQFMGTPAAHSVEAPARVLLVSGYHNAFPGTVGMYEEIARREADLICRNDLGSLTLDGFGEASGHGGYDLNVYLDTMHKVFRKHGREVLVTSSPSQSILNWHMISYFSWGEFNLFAGFRGTMLDYRLGRQEEIEANLIPAKMGQYYPNSETTLEDIEWLMARTAGWNSGVDFAFGIDKLHKNPRYKDLCQSVRDWEAAKLADAFTEKQKMEMRQTDRLYHLSKSAEGKWTPEFTGFWRHKGLKILPSSAIAIEAQAPASVRPCSTGWATTHDPGIYIAAGLSDDMVHSTKNKSSNWKVTLPAPENPASGTKQKLQFVLRLPAESPCAVKNIKISVADKTVTIPATLAPGEYLANPHALHRAFVYGPDHHIRREIHIPQFNPYWFLPEINKGEKTDISLTCEPADPDANCQVLLNLAVHQNLYDGWN